MEIIKNRLLKLRAEIEKIESNRGKLDFLKNYYLNKTAIIVATGPNFTEYIETIKNNINENTILICIKQSIKHFDMCADFHVLNQDHYEEYYYDNNYKPIVLFHNYSKPDSNNIRYVNPSGDINFFFNNLNDIKHNKIFIWDYLTTTTDVLTFNDDNLGNGENMVVHGGHIMIEMAIPLCVTMGIKNIILNGFVGGNKHGTEIKNELQWDNPCYEHLFLDQERLYEKSKFLDSYLCQYNIKIYSLCDTKYHIKKISIDEFKNIIN